MLDLSLTVNIAVGFNSMTAGIMPVQSQPRVDATRWWSTHGMHGKSSSPAVRLLLFKSTARAFCRCCGIGSYALLKKCVHKLLASLDCGHLRTPCYTSIPADTRSSMSRWDLAGQALYCACRTACTQIMSVGSVFCHQSCAHSPQQCTDIPVIPHLCAKAVLLRSAQYAETTSKHVPTSAPSFWYVVLVPQALMFMFSILVCSDQA